MNLTAEQAYPTPFARSPLLPMLLLSLATQRHVPKTVKVVKEEYDYIIVGAGSAGSTLAARLSEEPCVSVLLLEAGTHDVPLLNEIPAISRTFWFTDLDWQYKTVPQNHTGEALVNRQLTWPSGKGLGGSSLLNTMLYVRGNRKNYDDWAAQGASGWSFNDVYQYFIRMEDNKNMEYWLNRYHNKGGPLTVEKPKYQSEIKAPILEAAKSMGLTPDDSNGGRQTGFYEFQATYRNQQRCSTAKAYLVPAENRTNLDIVTGAYVRKVIVHKRRAMGVRFDFKNKTVEVKAKREVIMSAGTTNTAQLLMLSGIGPKEHLRKFKIPCLADLPVGNNLQDHCAAFLPYSLNPGIPTVKEKLTYRKIVQEYIDRRTGPLASAEFISSIAFLNSRPSPYLDFPDYQLYFAEISQDALEKQVNLKPEVFKAVWGPYEDSPMFVCLSSLLQPKSRGTVRLNSTNPYDPPLIDPNYFEDSEDLKMIVEGLKTCHKIATSEPMKKVGAKPIETLFPGCESFAKDEDLYLTCIARGAVITFSHQVGTAKMGAPTDPTTVVDPLLRVKGIRGLRVVDASVMPIVPSANTNIPTIMVAEKAADIIKKTIRCAQSKYHFHSYEYYRDQDYTYVSQRGSL